MNGCANSPTMPLLCVSKEIECQGLEEVLRNLQSRLLIAASGQ